MSGKIRVHFKTALSHLRIALFLHQQCLRPPHAVDHRQGVRRTGRSSAVHFDSVPDHIPLRNIHGCLSIQRRVPQIGALRKDIIPFDVRQDGCLLFLSADLMGNGRILDFFRIQMVIRDVPGLILHQTHKAALGRSRNAEDSGSGVQSLPLLIPAAVIGYRLRYQIADFVQRLLYCRTLLPCSDSGYIRFPLCPFRLHQDTASVVRPAKGNGNAFFGNPGIFLNKAVIILQVPADFERLIQICIFQRDGQIFPIRIVQHFVHISRRDIPIVLQPVFHKIQIFKRKSGSILQLNRKMRFMISHENAFRALLGQRIIRLSRHDLRRSFCPQRLSILCKAELRNHLHRISNFINLCLTGSALQNFRIHRDHFVLNLIA